MGSDEGGRSSPVRHGPAADATRISNCKQREGKCLRGMEGFFYENITDG